MKKWLKCFVQVLVVGMVMTSAMPVHAGLLGKKTTTTQEQTEYRFTYKDTTIQLNKEAKPILDALGSSKKIFEQESCAYQGMDRIYIYDGVEIGTYPVKGVEYISSIYFVDNTVQTQEAIKLGSTYNEMIKAYGSSYKEEFGVYRYTLGQVELSIYTTNKIVDGIEYQIKLDK